MLKMSYWCGSKVETIGFLTVKFFPEHSKLSTLLWQY
jgi:hypothetical protein